MVTPKHSSTHSASAWKHRRPSSTHRNPSQTQRRPWQVEPNSLKDFGWESRLSTKSGRFCTREIICLANRRELCSQVEVHPINSRALRNSGDRIHLENARKSDSHGAQELAQCAGQHILLDVRGAVLVLVVWQRSTYLCAFRVELQVQGVG